MTKPFWHDRALARQLSQYLDGELDARERDALLERLALDPGARARLQALRRTDELAREAGTPPAPPDVPAALAHLEAAAAAGASAQPAPAVPPGHLRPALLASAGLLVTAGLALFELRRRRLI